VTEARVLDRLQDILEGIRRIETYRQGRDFGDYRREPMLRDSIERNLERISKASRHIPDEMKADHAEIPWQQIAGIGNVLRHAYRKVNDRTIWETVEVHLPRLKTVIHAMIAAVEGKGGDGAPRERE
jgi:uncharacterized protein with HEPN domain